MFYSMKPTWFDTVLTIMKNEKSTYIWYFFYSIDIFEKTTYASLLKKKSLFITLCPRKGLQLTEKSSSYRLHYTFYYMVIETEIIVARMACKVFFLLIFYALFQLQSYVMPFSYEILCFSVYPCVTDVTWVK